MIGKGLDCLEPIYLMLPEDKRYHEFTNHYRVPCGHCLNCRQARALEWSLRLDCESKYWDKMCFVTLTYKDEDLPTVMVEKECYRQIGTDLLKKEFPYAEDEDYYYIPTVNPDDISSYIKRLRKLSKTRCRYYGVVEYGTRRGRPHVHILIFGFSAYDLLDRAYLKRAWQDRGIVDIRPVYNHTTAVYIGGYVQKKLYGDDKRIYCVPEKMRCSQHLGERWLLDHIHEFDDEHAYIVQNDYKHPLPRQFRKILVEKGVLSKFSPLNMAEVQFQEYLDFAKSCDSKGVSMEQVFYQRFLNARQKLMRKNSKRAVTGDI